MVFCPIVTWARLPCIAGEGMFEWATGEGVFDDDDDIAELQVVMVMTMMVKMKIKVDGCCSGLRVLTGTVCLPSGNGLS